MSEPESLEALQKRYMEHLLEDAVGKACICTACRDEVHNLLVAIWRLKRAKRLECPNT
jgi:hypothetical protein